MLALYWLVQGYGYDVTRLDVLAAHTAALQAAALSGREQEMRERLRTLVADAGGPGATFVAKTLASLL